MDDFPQDELDDSSSFHITPSPSSALAAFSESLNPPSPILTPSQLTFTWSSGDIPVVLFDDAYATDGRVLTPTPTTNVLTRNRDSYASSNDADIRISDFKRTQVPSYRSSGIESQVDTDSVYASESSDTLASVGTFGPRRLNLKSCEETSLSTGTSFSEIPSPTSRTPDYERRGTVSTRHHARGSSGETLPVTVVLEALTSQVQSSETRKALALGVNFSGDDKTTAFPPLRTGPTDCRSYDLPKIPATPNKVASDRTASWIHSQEWNSPQRQDYGFPEITSPVNETLTEKQFLTSPVTPTRRGILTGHDMNLIAASSPPSLPRKRRENQRHKSNYQVDPSHMMKNFREPKEDFAWLRDITVQILVDQEGFRAAQPSFKLSGIVHLRSSLELQTPSPAMAQFRPIIRQSFHFHYAAFETLPILRRVTTNDQETHDYVSRQAYLTIKYNGVYVVHGHEVSSADHDGKVQKLSWQFEYLIDDRRIDVSGRVIEGEKILTPLTFSCSPELLLPTQGKRINIMHVFKKGVSPKLSAEKLQPPGTPHSGPESPGAVSPCKADTRVSHSVFGGKGHGWSLHRRVQSHGTRQQDGHKTANSRAGTHSSGTHDHRTRTTVENLVNQGEFGRHRRASSVGNHSQAANYSSIIPHSRRNDSPIKTLPLTMPRHIIPPSRLAELFDNTEFSPSVPASIREPSTFTSLTPRPRSRHTWREKSEDFLQK